MTDSKDKMCPEPPCEACPLMIDSGGIMYACLPELHGQPFIGAEIPRETQDTILCWYENNDERAEACYYAENNEKGFCAVAKDKLKDKTSNWREARHDYDWSIVECFSKDPKKCIFQRIEPDTKQNCPFLKK